MNHAVLETKVEIQVSAKYAMAIAEALDEADTLIVEHIQNTGFVPTYLHMPKKSIAMLYLSGLLTVARDPQGKSLYMMYKNVMIKVDTNKGWPTRSAE